MKKRFGILLVVGVLLLVLTVAVACDPKTQTPEAQKYEMTFVTNGDAYVTIVAEAGSDISERLPADPQNEGAFFGGWSLENNGFASEVAELPKEMPEANVTYYARWTWHAIVVPKLQPLDDKGEPVLDKNNYVISSEDSITVEVDPQNPVLDMNNDSERPAIKGYRLSSGQEYTVTLDGKEKTVYLNFDRSGYNISFNLNNTAVSGKINAVRKYFGQKLELPDLPNDVSMPIDLRFAGWSTDYDGEKDYQAAGAEIEIGKEGSLVDGSVPSPTLYAVYDEAYIDFSKGQDFVFAPKHEEGVAYVRRIIQDASGGVLYTEFKGDYISNPSVSESSPHLGIFNVENEAGTTLNGYIYEDGHFAYKQTSFDPGWQGVELASFDLEQNQVVEGNKLKLIDLYGCASLELASPMSTFVLTSEGLESYTLEAGKYVGGYWYDVDLEDYCFTIVNDINGESCQIDFHFQFVQYPQTPDETYFAFAGKEMGMYCDSIDGNYLVGDIVILNGYDEAIGLIGDSQYTGQYYRVGENVFLVNLYNSANDYYTMLFSADLSTVEGANSSGTLIRYYQEKGDSALFVQCANADGSTFYSDGFGNGTYKPSNGAEISGEAEIVGEMFESTTPAVLYKLTTSGGEAHYFVMDYFMTANAGIDAHFTHFTSESDVDVKYLYSTSEKAGEYVGAIVTASSDAYYLTAVTTSAGNVIFSDINEGTVSAKNGGYLFTSDEYLISYEDDELRSNRYDAPTVTTEQMKLAELAFSVLDDGKELGTLTITQDGKATYTASQGGFTDAEYEFAYSSIIVKQGQDVTMFVVDEFGSAPKAFATVKKDLLVAATEEPQGELYIFKQGDKERAMLWMLMYDEMHFYAVADISVDSAPTAATKPMSGEKVVYLIDTMLSSYNAIKTQDGNYLAPNNLLRVGTFTIYDANTEKNGTDTMQLDAYGAVKYTQGTKTFEGSYEVADGVYNVTFNEAEGAPADFKFMLSSTNFMKVDYSEYYVVDPATLGVNSLLRIQSGTADDIDGKDAELFRASEDSSGNVNMGSSLAKGKITSGSEGIYTFSGKSKSELESDDMVFTFRFDEYIFTQRVFVRNNVTLPEGKFTEEGVNEQISKWVQLDKYGIATYFDGSAQHEGFYFIDGGMYRFVDDADRELDLQFTLNSAEKRLIIYGAEAKPFEGGEFDFTYKNAPHKLSITVEGEGKTLKAILKNNDGTAIATDEDLEVDDDGIYSFGANNESFKFIISKGNIVLYNPDLDYQLYIWIGNMWLLKEHGAAAIGNIDTATPTAILTVKGFNEIAEINNTAEVIKGSISSATTNKDYDLITFTDEYGNTQELYDITYPTRNGTSRALFIESSEKGLAIEYYYTMGATGEVVAYFDGLGRAYEIDETTGEATDKVIGYYFFDDYNIIEIGTLETTDDGTMFMPIAMYAPYGLRLTQLDGTSENITGVVAYNEKYDTIVIADDGSIFMFDGFDGVTYVDSLGVAHSGYFNNYGEMMTGTPDGRYLITDEYDNATLYFIDFDEGGTQSGSVTARRASYVVYTPYTNLYSEVQFMSADDYTKPNGKNNLPDEVPEGMQGFAILVIVIDGEQGEYWGFYTIEGGLMTIEVYDQDGKSTGDHIELALYVDGTADWNNCSEWLTSDAE